MPFKCLIAHICLNNKELGTEPGLVVVMAVAEMKTWWDSKREVAVTGQLEEETERPRGAAATVV